MRRLFLGGDDADFDFLEPGGFEPAVQIAFGKTEPAKITSRAKLKRRMEISIRLFCF
jgi:hypothetical protein